MLWLSYNYQFVFLKPFTFFTHSPNPRPSFTYSPKACPLWQSSIVCLCLSLTNFDSLNTGYPDTNLRPILSAETLNTRYCYNFIIITTKSSEKHIQNKLALMRWIQLVGESFHTPKCCRICSCSGHILRLRVQSPSQGAYRRRSTDVSLSLSLSSKINGHVLEWGFVF